MIIAIDIDGTLAASPPVVSSRLLRRVGIPVSRRSSREDLAAWTTKIARIGDALPVIPSAVGGVAALLERHPDARVHVVTARSDALHDATRSWLRAWFPALAWRPLLMRMGHELGPSLDVRRRQLHGPPRSTDPLWLFDDEPTHAALCDREGDVFRIAPQCWTEFAL